MNLDLLHKTTNCVGIALSHYFEVAGDLVPDPDMQIRIYPATKTAEALTYQDQFGYREVYLQGHYVGEQSREIFHCSSEEPRSLLCYPLTSAAL